MVVCALETTAIVIVFLLLDVTNNILLSYALTMFHMTEIDLVLDILKIWAYVDE